MVNKITSKILFGRIKIYIDDLLHISLPLDQDAKVHAWRDNESNFKIEIRCAGDTDIYEYTNFVLWEKILKELDKLI